MLSNQEIAQIETAIHEFIASISNIWGNEPLDGDETQEIADMVLEKLDDENGNRR